MSSILKKFQHKQGSSGSRRSPYRSSPDVRQTSESDVSLSDVVNLRPSTSLTPSKTSSSRSPSSSYRTKSASKSNNIKKPQAAKKTSKPGISLGIGEELEKLHAESSGKISASRSVSSSDSSDINPDVVAPQKGIPQGASMCIKPLDEGKQSGTESGVKGIKSKSGVKGIKSKSGVKGIKSKSGLKESGPKCGFKESGPKSGFKESGPESGFKESGPKSGFKESGPKSGFKESEPKSGFKESGPKSGFKQSGSKSGLKETRSKSGLKESGSKSVLKGTGSKSSLKESGSKSSVKGGKSILKASESSGKSGSQIGKKGQKTGRKIGKGIKLPKRPPGKTGVVEEVGRARLSPVGSGGGKTAAKSAGTGQALTLDAVQTARQVLEQVTSEESESSARTRAMLNSLATLLTPMDELHSAGVMAELDAKYRQLSEDEWEDLEKLIFTKLQIQKSPLFEYMSHKYRREREGRG